MQIVVQMSIEEFSELEGKTEWRHLNEGEIYVDLINNRWKAIKVIGHKQVYGGIEPILEEFPLQII